MQNFKEKVDYKEIPKVELHLHLDGSIPYDVASRLSKKSINEIASLMTAPDKCLNLSEYLTKFDFPISLMQTKESLYEVSKGLVNYLVEENVIYAEVRFAPMFHTKNGLSYEEVVEAVLKGLNENSNIKVRLILCMMRGFDREDNIKTMEVCEKYLNKGVCGLDLAGAEDKYPLDEYLDLFKIAKDKKIPFTIHAGENGDSKEVEKAIRVGAKRIGHGIHAIENSAVLNLIKEKDILLEVCPTSNVQTNAVDLYEKHPIYELFKKKIKISINTDNTKVSNITLSNEYKKLSNVFHFTLSDFKQMNIDSIKHAFISDKEKEQLIEVLERGY